MAINSNPVVMATALAGANNGPTTDLGGPGVYNVHVGGAIGSPAATVTVQASPDGGTTWIPVTGISLNALGSFQIQGGAGMRYRLVTAGGTATAINAWASQVS